MSQSNDWKRHIRAGDRVLAAVSGGGDSLLLALRLAETLPRLGATLSIMHVNHHMTEVADRDEQAVRALADRLGVEFEVGHLTDQELTAREGSSTSVEARLREERLRLLRDAATRQGARAIALGHTATDAAETFLLMALRGSGPRGLGSMRRVRELPGGMLLIRPLLDTSREEVIEQLKERGESWSSDPLNASMRYRRNRIRQEVLPLLRELEPGAVRVLARAAQRCEEESDLLEEPTRATLASVTISARQGTLVLDRCQLAEQPLPMIKLVLRRAWRDVRAAVDQEAPQKPLMYLPPQGDIIDGLAERIASGRQEEARFDPSRGVVATVRAAEVILRLQDATPTMTEAQCRAILLPPDTKQYPVLNSSQRFTPCDFEVMLPGEQGMLEIRIVPATEFDGQFDSVPFQMHRAAAFDARTIRKDLYLVPADEEAVLPLGQDRKKSVRDLLKEAHIAASDRPRVAVLADERGILWIPGVRRPATGFVTPRTQLVVVCEWHTPLE